MKKLIIISALVMGGLGITNASAQFGIHINLRLGTRPVYVAAQPVEVADQPEYNDDYYYLPDVEAYYSVGERCYYYQDGNQWISAAYLPGSYHDVDWKYAKHYQIHANRPYMHNDVYRGRFGGFANRNDYYARAYPNRNRYPNEGNRAHDMFDNRAWGGQNRGGLGRRDDRNQNAYNQSAPAHNQGGYNQPNQGGYSQPSPSQNQGGYNSQNPGRNQGGGNGYSQGSNTGNSQASPGQGQQGGRGNGQGQGGGSQPANHTGGQNSGGNTGTDHYAANKTGLVQDRGMFARPVRN